MRLVWPSRAALLMGVVLLAGPSGCGPGPAGEPGASTATTTASAPADGQRSGAPTPTAAASSSSLSAPAPTPTAAAGSSSPSAPAPRPEQKLVVPDWMAKELASPDVPVRLRALDRWAQQAPVGSVDPLMLALNDPNEGVRARALELIEQDWMKAERTEH